MTDVDRTPRDSSMNDRNEDPHQQASLSLRKFSCCRLVSVQKRLLADDPSTQRLISNGLQLRQNWAKGYFKHGLALHQQARPVQPFVRFAYALRTEVMRTGRCSRYPNLAQDLLLTGSFREGWRRYEDRRGRHGSSSVRDHCGEPWQGVLNSRPIKELLVAEQRAGGHSYVLPDGAPPAGAFAGPGHRLPDFAWALRQCRAIDQVVEENATILASFLTATASSGET